MAGRSGAPCVLIENPYLEYGAEFVSHLYLTYGIPSLCFYTDRAEKLARRSAPAVPGSILAEVETSVENLDDVAHLAAANYAPVAVVPFNETAVLPALYLAMRLRLDWAQPAVTPMFRNKYSLKSYIRRVNPALRMNASTLVATLEDVLEARRNGRYRRFILKPNAGYGNQRIAFFSGPFRASAVAEYLNEQSGTPVVMEDFIDGVEYFVNGQTDHAGRVEILGIFLYVRDAANGRHNIDTETVLVRQGSHAFNLLEHYVRELIHTTGLKRSPFHVEIKIDHRGACLIEAAARLAGHGNAFLCGELHGRRSFLIELASHFYLHGFAFGGPSTDWPRYNAHAFRYVHGIAYATQRLYSVGGLPQVEALPQFYEWVLRPVVGARIVKTTDCLKMPWSMLLRGGSDHELQIAAKHARELIRYNDRVGLRDRLRVLFMYLLPRAAAKLVRGARLHLGSRTRAPRAPAEVSEGVHGA